MKLSTDYGFAFLCIPKCGSTSIERVISEYCNVIFSGHPSLKHINCYKFDKYFQPLLTRAGFRKGSIEKFCVMREPVERIYSWYTYQCRPALKKPRHPRHDRYNGHISFEQYVNEMLSPQRPPYARIGTQAAFMRFHDGKLGVDKVFRLDQLEKVEEYLTLKIGQPIKIPHLNRSGPRRKKGVKGIFSWLPGNNAEAPSVRPEKKPMEISDELLAKLRLHLADDYTIYNSLAEK